MSRTILIVDDISINREILKKILGGEYEIMEASDGEQALALMKREHRTLSAVLLDLRMPKLDGFEVLTRMQEDDELTQLPVIVTTGQSDSESEERALRLGAQDYVSKPYQPAIIQQRIRNTIRLRESAATVNALRRDRLTGLYSRMAFFEEAEGMIAAHEPGFYVMACFDIDKFKVINDQYGTRKGDEVLRYIAGVFNAGFSAYGGICCRVASDDFAVLYPTTLLGSKELTRMRKKASRMHGLASTITFSIGRYVVNDLSLTASAMYDRAMLAAETVRGRYDTQIALYDESMRAHLIQEQEIVTEMASALKDGQFETWFQPQYNHSTGALIGAEALVRWRHPQKGLIPPGQFVPIFEQNGFIYTLDQFVWEDVCRSLRRWTDEGRSPLPVSVNISRFDVFRDDLVDVIHGLTRKYDIPVELLRLEITESAFAEDTGQIVTVVRRLIDLGFTLEIDDFGSGYSSLNTLKNVPAQVLKLDMRFLEDDQGSQRGGNIIESVVRMAKWLGMSVIAEGVEDMAQADYLRSIGCNYLQGYLYAKPMPKADYEALCQGTRKEEKLLVLETVENLDNNTFWNPHSMDTLIFNSYVGGACIYEYHDGAIELLRATEKYAQVIGSAGMTVEEALKLNWTEHLDDEGRQRILADLDEAVATRGEVTAEYRFLDLPGCPHETYLRSTMRVIASAGKRYLVYCTNENITAQRMAEQRERETSEQLQTIMQNVNGGISAITLDGDGRGHVVFANQRYYDMFGYTAQQVETELRSVLDIVHPDDRHTAREQIMQIFADHKPREMEYRCVCRDGGVVYVRGSKSVARIAGYDQEVLISALTDITELVQTERRAQRVSEQLQIILDNISSAVIAVVFENGAPRLLMTNDRYYEQRGYTREQYAAEVHSPFDAVHPEDRVRVTELSELVTATGQPHTVQYRIIRRDGAVRWMQSSVSVTSVPGEKLPVQLTVAKDITEQYEAEQQVRRVSDQMRAIMDNVDQGILASVVSKGTVRVLFANERYFQQLGYTREQFEREVHDPFVTIAPEDRERVRLETEQVTRTQHPTVLEFSVVRRDGSLRFFRTAISVGRIAGEEMPVQMSIFRDITDEKIAAQRERRTAEQMQAIMNDIGSGIMAAIFRNRKMELLFSNERYYQMLGYTREQYAAEVGDPFAIVHPDDRAMAWEISMEAYETYQPTLMEYRVLRRDGTERWMRVGLSSTRFTGVEPDVHLCIYTDITDEKRTQQKLQDTTQQMRTMMDDIPGGFVRLHVEADGTLLPTHFSEGFYRLVGMGQRELLALYGNDAYAGVHPDDVPAVRQAIARMLEKGEARSSLYRLRHGDDGYVWVSIFGRATADDTGDTFLSIYYTDATEQARVEEQQRELLDNLPQGAALYEFDGERLYMVHINKRYWELVGRQPTEYEDTSFLNAVHPDDQDVISRELTAAIAQNRDVSCDVRIRHGQDEYRPFHVAGHIIAKPDGCYAIYASYTPISHEAMNYQQMLPVILSAIMESTSDLTFVKDRSYHYLCASQAFAHMVGRESEAELVGKTDYDLFEKSIADKYRHDDEALLASGHSLIDMVEDIPSADGVPHYSSTSKYLLRDADGNLIGLYGVGRDITEYRDAFSKLRLLTDHLPGGIATYECSPGEYRLLYCNDGFCSLFDVTREELAQSGDVPPRGWVLDADREALISQLNALMEHGAPMDYAYRVRNQSGGYRWISHRAAATDRRDGKVIVHAMLQDVTAQRELMERLRLSEEENTLAIRLSGSVICRYLVADRTLTMTPEVAEAFSLPQRVVNVPREPVRLGLIAPESAGGYTAFFESILHGGETGQMLFRQRYLKEWRWMEAKSATIFADDGKPAKAVISFRDVTEQLEKEAIYQRWQQSLEGKPPESYSLFRVNLSKRTGENVAEGLLVDAPLDTDVAQTEAHTAEYAEKCVVDEDRAAFAAFLDIDAMLQSYASGDRTLVLEYREKRPGGVRWLRLTLDLIENPRFAEVEAYLMFEDIDAAKRAELDIADRAERDPLTGVLNRATFAARADERIRQSDPGEQHALMMLDLVGFKQVNDAFGHGAGDQLLVDVAAAVRATLRHDDLVGRLGGDEFIVFLTGAPNDAAIAAKARQICALARKVFNAEVSVSGSVGIAVYPRDGGSFEALYRRVDAALYAVKGAGKDDYAFFREGMVDDGIELPPAEAQPKGGDTPRRAMHRRMLIVDDSQIDHAMLAKIFFDDFVIEKAKDGASGLMRLRHYGAAISVVLLDLMMPGIDGFEVLRRMQESPELRGIPVVVVSGDGNRETSLRAIRAGASDFVMKPVDPDVLRIRVQSAISKAENERLRAKNSFLEYRSGEVARYKTVLERSDTVVVEHDWINGSFLYDPAMSQHIAGRYDNRTLWGILLMDFVTDTDTVRQIQQLAHELARDRHRSGGALMVRLKTPTKAYHWFRVRIDKVLNEIGLTGKLYLSFHDLGANRPGEGEEPEP